MYASHLPHPLSHLFGPTVFCMEPSSSSSPPILTSPLTVLTPPFSHHHHPSPHPTLIPHPHLHPHLHLLPPLYPPFPAQIGLVRLAHPPPKRVQLLNSLQPPILHTPPLTPTNTYTTVLAVVQISYMALLLLPPSCSPTPPPLPSTPYHHSHHTISITATSYDALKVIVSLTTITCTSSLLSPRLNLLPSLNPLSLLLTPSPSPFS